MFGIVVQPFCEPGIGEKEIPKVEVSDGIFRCKRCQSYINSKYEISYNKSNKRVAICNLCKIENELDSSKSNVKSEYFSINTEAVPELSVPTVDFIAPSSMKHKDDFFPHYIFLIDISNLSLDLGLSNYVNIFLH